MFEANELLVPCSYSRLIARELGLQERDLMALLAGTGLQRDVLLSSAERFMNVEQQIRILENAKQIAAIPEFGLRLGECLTPSTHGPMGYLVLSSPNVGSALRAFANFLPTRMPFSSVEVTSDSEGLRCTLVLHIKISAELQRLLQECFALMIQAIVESVSGRVVRSAEISLQHKKPGYHQLYPQFLHSPVSFAKKENAFYISSDLASCANANEQSASYAVAQDLCSTLLQSTASQNLSTRNWVERLLLSSPLGRLSAVDVAQAMFITKRTLQRRLDREGTSFREILERLLSELAARHLLDSDLNVETIALTLGYNDASAFRKAFHRWYGQSPTQYRRAMRETA